VVAGVVVVRVVRVPARVPVVVVVVVGVHRDTGVRRGMAAPGQHRQAGHQVGLGAESRRSGRVGQRE
jgi:hypothetical protein